MNDAAFLDLCARMLDGTVSPGDLQRWNERLAIDPHQRRLYRDFCGQQVWLEEELAGAPWARAVRPARENATPARLAAAAAAALLVTTGAWWWNRGAMTGQAQPDPAQITAPAPEFTAATPSAFTYPFEGFPDLQPESAELDPNPELRVVALDGTDPRIVSIAQRLAGVDFSAGLDL